MIYGRVDVIGLDNARQRGGFLDLRSCEAKLFIKMALVVIYGSIYPILPWTPAATTDAKWSRCDNGGSREVPTQLAMKVGYGSAEELKNNGCQETYESPRKVLIIVSSRSSYYRRNKFRIEQQLSAKVDISSEKEADCTQHETIDLKSKLQSKEAKIEKMKYEHLTREAALAKKELLEEEYKKKFDEAKKELSLENDLAGM
ncbi:hypothetical protein ZEAMMB73_Zm00001d046181 [Zea mays]|uniref:Uncharacterized protein n=1 Tax=Zea mays TaxID=4577 RepID=A0A1D6P141_MAIZE|nr:hypothetical protein ZEAMMB73_Zm00001d046181 [Zea mays]